MSKRVYRDSIYGCKDCCTQWTDLGGRTYEACPYCKVSRKVFEEDMLELEFRFLDGHELANGYNVPGKTLFSNYLLKIIGDEA